MSPFFDLVIEYPGRRLPNRLLGLTGRVYGGDAAAAGAACGLGGRADRARADHARSGGRPLNSAHELIGLSERTAPTIFHSSHAHIIRAAGGLLEHKYNPAGLEKAAKEMVGRSMLSEALTDVMISAYAIEKRRPVFFKSAKARKDPAFDHPMWLVARAATSAPTFFPPAKLEIGDQGDRLSLPLMRSQSPRFERYVALGDSTTEGLMDPDPRGGERHRGWADRLAERLARRNPRLLYANLAIRGRKLPQIRAEQLGPALAMEPDLASVLGGVNDILRPGVDLEARATDLEAIVASLRGAGATVLLVNFPDIAGSISFASARFGPRLRSFNATIREIAARQRALLVDLEGDGVHHPALWAPDRLHASPIGHERMADLAAAALGLDELDPDWIRTLPEPPAQPRPLELARNVAWAGRYLAPWVLRRLRGTSSGDGIGPKRPALEPIEPVD